MQKKIVGHKIVPNVVSLMNERSKEISAIKMRMIRCFNTLAEVYATDKLGTERRYRVDIAHRTCSCRKWQITGMPCHHALYFISKLRGEGSEVEILVDEYFSVAKICATYA